MEDGEEKTERRYQSRTTKMNDSLKTEVLVQMNTWKYKWRCQQRNSELLRST